MRLHHVAVACRSRKNADRFYRDVLGLEMIKEKTLDAAFVRQLFGVHDACELVMYGNARLAIEVFVPASSATNPDRFAHCYLEVTNRDDFIERCKRADVPVQQVPLGESLVVFVRDYDGNQFEIKELPPSGDVVD